MQDEEKGFPASGHNEIIKLSVLLTLIAVVVLGATLGICGLALGWFKEQPSSAGLEPEASVVEEEPEENTEEHPSSVGLQPTASPQREKPIWPAGTAWDTGSGSYYYMEDGEY